MSFLSPSLFKKSHAVARQAGFTLIELILYMAIVVIIIGALIPFAWNIIGTGTKSSAQQEVFTQARYTSERIKYEIRNAAGINSVSATSISLVETNAAVNPTIIDLSAGKLRIKQGAGAAVVLNSTDTIVSGLTFTTYTSLDNKTKHIGFTYTIGDNYNSARAEYQVPAVVVESSAEVRSN